MVCLHESSPDFAREKIVFRRKNLTLFCNPRSPDQGGVFRANGFWVAWVALWWAVGGFAFFPSIMICLLHALMLINSELINGSPSSDCRAPLEIPCGYTTTVSAPLTDADTGGNDDDDDNSSVDFRFGGPFSLPHVDPGSAPSGLPSCLPPPGTPVFGDGFTTHSVDGNGHW